MELKRLRNVLKDKNIDLTLIFSKDMNFKYFNNFNDCTAVMAISQNNSFIINLDWDSYKLKKYSKIKKIIAYKKSLVQTIKKKGKTFRRIGINHGNITVSQYKQLRKDFKNSKFTDISRLLQELRSKKTNEEISKINKACNITDKVLHKLARELSSKKTEAEIANFIKKEIEKNNCTEAFPTIVASGKNSANIHHTPRNTKLKGFTIIDLGVKYNGYCSDVTRTFYIGNPNEKEINDYYKILRIINSIKTASDIKKAKLPKNQYHSLGHSLGIEVHEYPIVNKNAKIEDNMVITIEPGSYYKNHSIRIEDTCLVKNNKLINLNKFTKNLIVIKK